MIKNQNDLNKLMDNYIPYVAKITSSIGGHFLSKEDKEEIISDVFYAIYVNRKKLIADKDIKPYMAQIARNKTKNKLREIAKSQAQIIENIDEIQDMNNTMFEDSMITSQQIEEIENAINSFDNPEKEILCGYYFYGFKINEMASRLSLPTSTVKSKLYRSRQKLQNLLIEGGIYERYI